MRKILVSVIIILITLNIFSDFAEKSDVFDVDAPPAKTIQQPDSVITQDRTNPFLYNNVVGCAMDGILAFIPVWSSTMLIFSSLEFRNINLGLTGLTIPFGMVLTEKLVKSIIINKVKTKKIDSYNNVFAYANIGYITPAIIGPDEVELDVPYFNIYPMLKLGVGYKYNINERFAMLLLMEQYIKYYSVGIGISFSDYTITFDNVLFEPKSESLPEGGHTVVYKSWIGKFPGIGLGWTKRFYMYKGFFIEPGLQLKIAGAINGEDASLLGIFGGINIGYRF